MKIFAFLFIVLSSIVFGANECVVCHEGIEDIRDRNSEMMKAILKVAEKAGHEGNDCIVCHGGNPYNKSAEYGHKGTVKYFKENDGPKSFYPKPTDTDIITNTCGTCHKSQVKLAFSSMMINFKSDANETNTSLDSNITIGSKKYVEYMQKLSEKEPKAFIEKAHRKYSKKTSRSCSNCHIPYANDGLYKGSDVRIDKISKGHILTHQIQSSADVRVSIDDNNYTGTPLQTCAKCHNERKYTATSYIGSMKLNAKHINMQEDIHFKKGMVCQDCHTSNDMHGSGFDSNEALAAVEIECQDCHGTTKKYPWELPIGFSDEFSKDKLANRPRGVAKDLAEYIKQGFIAPSGDGYLLSARANPLPNVVKKENSVLVYLANGKSIELKPLKLLKNDHNLSKEAIVAMDSVEAHTDKLECYTCHVKWAPQYYKDKKNSLIRFENPALAQNGEGRISPIIPKGDKSITIQPHTITDKSRSCESCHTSMKAVGEGIDGIVNDLTKTKEIKSSFSLASTLNKEQIDNLDRSGSCVACHKEIPEGNLAVSTLAHVTKFAQIDINKTMHNDIIHLKMNVGTWTQVLGVIFIGLLIMVFIYYKFIKKKPINPRNIGWK